MIEINNVGFSGPSAGYYALPTSRSPVGAANAIGRATGEPARPSAIDSLSPSSTLRTAFLESIRSQITSGEYETPERIQGTVERLLDVIA